MDEGWRYSLRLDDGVPSAGFVLRDRGPGAPPPDHMWPHLLCRYPTIGALFADAKPLMPPLYNRRIQHRLTHAVGGRWPMLPPAFAFVDPHFSTGSPSSL